MKINLFLFGLLSIGITSFSQNLGGVTMSLNGNLKSFSFFTSQNAIINLSPDGNILEFGTEMESWRMGYYPGKLKPFEYQVAYYDNNEDEAFRGKLKNIGTCYITYYLASENQFLAGKVKRLGNLNLDYFLDFEDDAFKGRIQNAGNTSFTYFAKYDNEALRGKLKSVGFTSINYYDSFEDKAFVGKIKNIGQSNYTYYSSFERSGYQGALKSGATVQSVNGVLYFLRY